MINPVFPGVRGQRREEVGFLMVDVLLNHYTGILFREHEGFPLDVRPVFLPLLSFVFCQLLDRASLSVRWAICEVAGLGFSQLSKFIQNLHLRLPGFLALFCCRTHCRVV